MGDLHIKMNLFTLYNIECRDHKTVFRQKSKPRIHHCSAPDPTRIEPCGYCDQRIVS